MAPCAYFSGAAVGLCHVSQQSQYHFQVTDDLVVVMAAPEV
jgi:hypothetical protein